MLGILIMFGKEGSVDTVESKCTKLTGHLTSLGVMTPTGICPVWVTSGWEGMVPLRLGSGIAVTGSTAGPVHLRVVVGGLHVVPLEADGPWSVPLDYDHPRDAVTVRVEATQGRTVRESLEILFVDPRQFTRFRAEKLSLTTDWFGPLTAVGSYRPPEKGTSLLGFSLTSQRGNAFALWHREIGGYVTSPTMIVTPLVRLTVTNGMHRDAGRVVFSRPGYADVATASLQPRQECLPYEMESSSFIDGGAGLYDAVTIRFQLSHRGEWETVQTEVLYLVPLSVLDDVLAGTPVPTG